VFNPAEQKCDEPENVPGCQDYYKIWDIVTLMLFGCPDYYKIKTLSL
jgi:hypothetical protein